MTERRVDVVNNHRANAEAGAAARGGSPSGNGADADSANGGLPTELAYKIFLDRYARKDVTRGFAPGDLAIVPIVEDRKWSKKELGRVLQVDELQLEAELLTGEARGERRRFRASACDRPVETTLRQVAERIDAGLAAV